MVMIASGIAAWNVEIWVSYLCDQKFYIQLSFSSLTPLLTNIKTVPIFVRIASSFKTCFNWIFRYLKFAVLVITFVLVALSGPIEVQAERSRRLPKMVCITKESTFQKRRLTNAISTSTTAINSITERTLESSLGFDNDINYESSFWLRNACHQGFVVIKEQSKVLAQHEGLHQHDEEGKIFSSSIVY